MADDDKDIRSLIANLLRNHGHRVITVDDGEKVLTETKRMLLDLIILDVVMPKIDGYGVQTKLFQNPSTRHIPIMILTVGKTKDLFESASNVAAFMQKPFNNNDLVNKVAEILNKTHKGS